MDIESHIRYLVKQLNLSVIYNDCLDNKGYYIENTNIIVVKQGLSDLDEVLVLLHEIGHAAKHKGEMSLYNLAFSLHSKMENEAEEFMIENLIKHYAEYTDQDNANWLKFMEDYEIEPKYEFVVKELMTSTYLGSEQFRSFVK